MSASQLELRTQMSKSPMNKHKNPNEKSPERQKTLKNMVHPKDRSEGCVMSDHESLGESASRNDIVSPSQVMSPRSNRASPSKKISANLNNKKNIHKKMQCEQAKLTLEQVGL